jgi:hypothetical protein
MIQRAIAVSFMFITWIPFSQQASAQDVYVEVDYMQLDMEFSGTPYDAKPPALQARAGSFLFYNVGLEAIVAFGMSDDDFSPSLGDSARIEMDAMIGVNAVGRIPIGRFVELFGRVGFAKLEVSVAGLTALGIADGSYDKSDAQYGIGFLINLSDYSGIVFEYARLPDIKFTDGRTENTSINLGYRWAPF